MSHNDILKQRGILAPCVKAGLKPTNGAQPGWSYPVFDTHGAPYDNVKRWKALEKSKDHASYLWDPAEADPRPKYYALPGLPDAIKAASGVLHMAAGEPDVWTFHAAGLKNVLCWFGENSVPDTLADDLKRLGVTTAYYYPDHDNTGRKAAEKVHKRLFGSGIDYQIRQWRDPQGDGYDANQVWQRINFDAAHFNAQIENALIMELPDPEPEPSRKRAAPPDTLDADLMQLYERWALSVEDIAIRTWNVSPANAKGYSKVHFNVRPDDDTPSAQWNYQTHGYHDFGPHEDYNTHEVAEKLGLPTWDDYKAQHLPPPVRTPAQPRNNGQTSPKTPPVVAGANVARQILQARRDKTPLPGPTPFLAPYEPLRKMGGYWQLWQPCSVIAMIGPPGSGKTSLLETCMDGDQQEGRHCLISGPEWSPMLYKWRQVARWGGPTFEEQRFHDVWEKEEQHKVPLELRHGKCLSSDLLDKRDEILNKILGWPGDVHYITATGRLTNVLKVAHDEYVRLQDTGIVVREIYFDYIQKYTRRGDSAFEIEFMLNAMSTFCIQHELVGIVCSQPNKAIANLLKRGKLLDQAAGQFMSDQQAQAVLTLNPDWRIDKITKSETRFPYNWLYSVKNNMAPVPLRIKVKTDLGRHRFLNQIVDDDWENRDDTVNYYDQDDDNTTSPLELPLDWYHK